MKKRVSAVLCLLIAMPAWGQQSLGELLDKVRQDRLTLSADSRARSQITDEDELKTALDAARKALSLATEKSAQLDAQYAANDRELRQASQFPAGELHEVAAVVRQYAGDIAGVLKHSLVTAQFGGSSEVLERLSAAANIPSPEDLHAFHVLMLQEMTQAGAVSRFNTEVINATGIPVMADVVRVGSFNLIADNRFLRYEISNRTIQELARQPAGRYRSDARNLFDATNDITTMAVDPTGGQLLGRLIQAPSVSERLKQGGPVGYIIIALGALGLLIGVYRLLYLGTVAARINRQLKTEKPDEANALGRILSVYDGNVRASTEALELRLDEAILRETPVLEKWQAALKVIAAVAPLLGLLGTVIGMIETFQQITLSGSSDPSLMADGISKALVTTMLGLLVAIPIVLIHSMVASRSKHLIEILEEQSAAIIAHQAESKR